MKTQTDMTPRDWARAIFWIAAAGLMALSMLGALPPMADNRQSGEAASDESFQFSLDKSFEYPALSNPYGAPVDLVPLAGDETVAVYEHSIMSIGPQTKGYGDFTASHPAWPGGDGANNWPTEHIWTGAGAQGNKLLVAGLLQMGDGHMTVARFRADAMFDPTFGKAGVVILKRPAAQTSRATSLVVDGHGRVVLAGLARLKGKDGEDGQTHGVFLARLLANGQLDQSFGRKGIVILGAGDHIDTYVGAQLLLLPDGRMMLSAARAMEGKWSAIPVPWIRRLDANGAVDPMYGGGGNPIAFDADGKGFTPFRIVYSKASRGIFILGHEEVYGNSGRGSEDQCSVIKLRREGGRDKKFGNNGVLRFMPQGGARNCGFYNAVELDNGDLMAGGYVWADDAKFGRGEVFFLKHISGGHPPGGPLAQGFQFLRKTNDSSFPTSRRTPMLLEKDRLTISTECRGSDASRYKIGECEHENILLRLKRDRDAAPIAINPMTQSESEANVLAAIRKRDFKEYKSRIDDCGDPCRTHELVYVREVQYAAIFDAPEILDDLLSHPGRPKNGLIGVIVGPQMFGSFTCAGLYVSEPDALQIAVLDKQAGLLKRLLKAASPAEKNIALNYAVKADRTDYMELIVAAGADIRSTSGWPDDQSNRLTSSLLDDAIGAQAPNALRWLIAHGLPVDGVAATDPDPGRRWTTLHAWVRDAASEEFSRGNINAMTALLDILLAAGARQDILVDMARSAPQQSALVYAIYGVDAPTTVRTLVAWGARTNGLNAAQRADLDRIMRKASNAEWRKHLEQQGEDRRLAREEDDPEPCLEKRLLEYRSGDEASARERLARPRPATGARRSGYPKPNWSDDLVPDEAAGEQ